MFRKQGLFTPLLLALMPMGSAHAGLDTVACKLKMLENLGWTVEVRADATAVQITEGEACTRDDLAEIRASGDLRLSIPPTLSEADAPILTQALSSMGSRCAFKARIAVAAPLAAKKLQANPNYRFTRSGDGFAVLPSEWRSVRADTLFAPRSSSSAAIESLYTKAAATECAVGLQLAHWSTLYEAFGPSKFDHAFNGYLAVGTWDDLKLVKKSVKIFDWEGSNSITNTDFARLSQSGKLAMVGVSGVIANVLGQAALNSKSDRNENLIITQISKKAAEEIKAQGGLDQLNLNALRIWKLSRAISETYRAILVKGYLEPETITLDGQQPVTVENLIPLIGETSARAFLEMRELLHQPIFREVEVFVHPLGRQTLLWHFVHQLKINSRTPYQLKIYPDEMLTLRYQDYVHALAAETPECL